MSETKVPMPEPAIPVTYAPAGGYPVHASGGKVTVAMVMPQPYYTASQLTEFGDARASERDAFWMAKVAELEKEAARWRQHLRIWAQDDEHAELINRHIDKLIAETTVAGDGDVHAGSSTTAT